jgi:hypothetical protein
MIDFYETKLVCYRCKASSWECIDERRTKSGQWEDVLECVFCGVLEKAAGMVRSAPLIRPQGDASSFKFQYGRFAGMTFAEADAEPNGRRYLEHLRDTNEKLRTRITEYLESAAPSA